MRIHEATENGKLIGWVIDAGDDGGIVFADKSLKGIRAGNGFTATFGNRIEYREVFATSEPNAEAAAQNVAQAARQDAECHIDGGKCGDGGYCANCPLQQAAPVDTTQAQDAARSVEWCMRVAHEAGVWPDDTTLPAAICQAVLKYQKAMVKVDLAAAQGRSEVAPTPPES